MYRKLILCLCVVLLTAVTATAQNANGDKPPKTKVVSENHKASSQKVNKDKTSEAKTVNDNKKATVKDENKDKPSETKAVNDKNKKAKEQDENKDTSSGVKELSGMSVVGNDEAPTSLYIVPWKGSQLSGETSLDMMLSEKDVPVERDVFKRSIDFYEVSTEK
jgi:hypothetical protein